MGHPPEEDFVAGIQCALFEGTFGVNTTPAFVKCIFENVIVCPPYPNPPPNGAYILSQQVGGCWWRFVGAGGVIDWSIIGGGSLLWQDGIFPMGGWFGGVGLLDIYVNANTCPGFAGHQGTGVITWGPEIPKL